MPFDPASVPKRLMEAGQHGTVVPLVGSGVSRQAGSKFPTWIQLLNGITDYAVSKNYMSSTHGEEVKQLVSKQELLMAVEVLAPSIRFCAGSWFWSSEKTPSPR
jgi:hypothetical protein